VGQVTAVQIPVGHASASDSSASSPSSLLLPPPCHPPLRLPLQQLVLPAWPEADAAAAAAAREGPCLYLLLLLAWVLLRVMVTYWVSQQLL
jgi:hypothetical protein